MAKHRWPTDPPGKPASHSISWTEHERNRNQGGFVNTYNQYAQSQGAPQYGTPAYQAAYDPTQPFGTPQPVGARVPDFNEQYQTTTANRNVALSNAEATYQTGQINRQFGTPGQYDASNPYSQASLYETAYKQGQRGDNTSFASQGQLYSGAYQNQINERTRQHGAGVNDLATQQNAALHNVTSGQLQTYANAGSSVSDAQFQALLRALGNG
jgi:hypothetical protein